MMSANPSWLRPEDQTAWESIPAPDHLLYDEMGRSIAQFGTVVHLDRVKALVRRVAAQKTPAHQPIPEPTTHVSRLNFIEVERACQTVGQLANFVRLAEPVETNLSRDAWDEFTARAEQVIPSAVMAVIDRRGDMMRVHLMAQALEWMGLQVVEI
jgi:hypothetical protein